MASQFNQSNKNRTYTPRRKRTRFNPNRDFLQKAMADYIEKGGKIKQLERQPEVAERLCNYYRSNLSTNSAQAPR